MRRFRWLFAVIAPALVIPAVALAYGNSGAPAQAMDGGTPPHTATVSGMDAGFASYDGGVMTPHQMGEAGPH